MKTSIKKELTSYINDCKADGREVTRFNLFNEDYYIIGYYNCSEWLKEHDLDAFEAISIVKDYEMDNFGSFTTDINSEGIVNMLVYIYGEELCNELGIEID